MADAKQLIYDLCRDTSDVVKINLPRTVEYVENGRGQKLHVRTYWPDHSIHMATLIFIHGYASHGNRPTQAYVSSQCLEKGIAYVCIDLSGHGYSQGERALVTSVEDLHDDIFSLLKAIYRDKEDTSEIPRERNLTVPAICKQRPFFLAGQSMGGALALSAGKIIRSNPEILGNSSQLFGGCSLIGPAIAVKAPGAVAMAVFEYLLVPLFGSYEMPSFLTPSVNTDSYVWRDDNFLGYIKRDDITRNPAGISYGGTIKFSTALTIVKLANSLESTVQGVNFPFLILHDPEDQITPISGCLSLMEKSTTPADDKSLIKIVDGRHDLLSNELIFVVETMVNWITGRVKKL